MDNCNLSLSQRLGAVAKMVNSFDTVADIGCDHGKLAAALVLSGKVKRIIAVDISAPSLEKTGMLFNALGLNNAVELRNQDGLLGITPGSVDCIVLAGMGGELIADILETGRDVAFAAKRIIMQPMSATTKLRQYLASTSYAIEDECIVHEAEHYYQLICAVHSQNGKILDERYHFLIGDKLVQKNDPLLMPMLNFYRDLYLEKLSQAKKKGVTPEPLTRKIIEIDEITKFLEDKRNEA